MPKEYGSEDASWESGIFKHPISGPVYLSPTGLNGDGQSDLVHHGGPDRALLLVNFDLIQKWGIKHNFEPGYGSFGENVTISGLNAEEVCLGDIWELGEVTLEVSQPRLPCSKLGRRLDRPSIVADLMQACEGGWYCRALKTGKIEAGQDLKLVNRPYPEITIRRAFDVFVYQRKDHAQLIELRKIEALSELWKGQIDNLLS